MKIQSTCSRFITNEIFSDFLSCQYKAYLKIQGRKGVVSEYQAMQDQQAAQFYIHGMERFSGSDVEFDVETISGEYSAQIHALHHPSHDSASAKKSVWVPILYSPRDNISKDEKLLLAYWSLLLSKAESITPVFGRIIHGRRYQNTKIDLTKLYEQANHILNALSQLKRMKEPPHLYLNRHCNVCEFKDQCHSLAIEQDNLSLLRGLTPKDIEKLNSKGVFTVNQYSYTFRPRRKRKRPTNYHRRHHPELQDLAIREDKIFIYETPELPTSNVHIYFDVEGIPDRRSYYLIGVVIEFQNQTVEHSLWACNEEEELKIFLDFLALLSNYDDYTLYHYGSYDTTYLKRMILKVSSTEKRQTEKVLTRCCNLLSFFYSNIYMPTYSNGLKDIASYLGHQWTHEFGSGIQSIVWRTQWEQEHSQEIELRLKRYNMDDCYALPKLRRLIASIIENDRNEKAASSAIDSKDGKGGDELLPQNIKYYSTLKSQSNLFSKKYVFDEMEYIRKCSYFDYQRQRVFVRTGPSQNKLRPGQRQRRNAMSRKNTLRTNEVVNIIERVCGRCHSTQIITSERLSKKVIDLKFTKSGVKKWVIQYVTNRYRCKACGYVHVPTRYKAIIYKFGHALMSLAIYHHIVNRHSSRQIQTNFYELFGIVVSHDTILRFMSYFAEYYKWTYGLLHRRILASRVVYADETPLKTKYEDAYVWVFTNNREVVSFYKATREGGFLVDYLKPFNGVLVTDFYSAYDAVDCKQQKCLIHLMRDFNDDILMNPFDYEFREMAKDFTDLLQGVVKTIDRYGLNKRYFKGHKQAMHRFLGKVATTEYKFDTSRQYKKRITKYKDNLFEFLNHDNVSWNNSNAEHAIKLLALHTNKNVYWYQTGAIEEYLLMESIYQTCEYNEISFLKYLISENKDIVGYIESHS